MLTTIDVPELVTLGCSFTLVLEVADQICQSYHIDSDIHSKYIILNHVLNKKSINTCKNYIYQPTRRPQSTETHETEGNNDTEMQHRQKKIFFD